jgi:hypothetical protein
MRTSAKLILTALTAALVLASAVGSASARSLSASEQSIRVSWTSLEFSSSLATIRCRVTLEGSFHARTIAKVARALIGAISRAIVGHACTGGEAWADNGTEAEPLGTAPQKLPFHVTYESFAGTLPNISSLGLLLSRISFVLQATSIGVSARCRYGRVEDNISGTATREAGGGITSLAPVAGRDRARLVEGLLNGGLCPGEGQFAGSSGPVTGLSNTNTITVTLI